MSLCQCGHLGDVLIGSHRPEGTRDGLPTAHGGTDGHGPCRAPGCVCPRFTWMRYVETQLGAAPPKAK
jgi:hypothetical protein